VLPVDAGAVPVMLDCLPVEPPVPGLHVTGVGGDIPPADRPVVAGVTHPGDLAGLNDLPVTVHPVAGNIRGDLLDHCRLLAGGRLAAGRRGALERV